jgi:Stage II sporulation protein E (SpoIIE)/GAF domain
MGAGDEGDVPAAPSLSRERATSTTRPGLRMFLLTLTIVVVMVLGGVLLVWRGYNSRRDDALDEMGGRAVAAADAAQRFFEERLALLGSIAESETVRSGDVEAIRAELSRFATPELGMDDLGFVDENGFLQVEPTPVDVSDRSYVQQSNSPFVSEAIIGRVTDEPLVVLAVPAIGDDGDRLGIIVATVHVATATEMIPTDEADHLQIVDRVGNLIYDDAPLAELRPPADPTALSLPEGDAEAVPSLDGDPGQVAAQAAVPSPEWQIVLVRDESSVAATARDTLVRELVLLGVVGALALIGAWFVARRIDRLHRAEVGHVGEMAALEKFSAALAAADSPAEVADVVSTHEQAVLGAQAADATEPGDPHRESLIATMTEQTALALERARSSAEVEHLATLGSALARATTTDEVIAAILDHGAVVDDVFAVRASIHDVERNTLRVVDRDPSRRRPDTVTEIPIQAAHPQAEAIRTGDLVTAADAAELRARFPDWGEAAIDAGVVAAVAAPFILGSDPVLGAMALTFDRPRRLDSRERALLSTVSRLGADALTRARRFEQEQRVAETLQASLQPERLPQVAGWRFTGVTLAGEAGSSVGGDWYDVAVLPHGAILLSVGDVTGRGPVAAGVMGLVRAAVRALALSDPDPASILEHTDDLLRGSTVHQLATAWVGLLDPTTGQLRFASAGHVPPLVLGPNGRRFLDDSPGLLLGTGLPGTRRSSLHEIEPDASIVAYTDGLCERRGESLEVGLKRMAVALGDGIGLDAAKVVRRLVGRPTADDIAIVVATRFPAVLRARAEESVATAG